MEKLKYKSIYLGMNIIKNKIEVKQDKYIVEKELYTLTGIDINGNRELIGMFFKKDDKRFFLDLLETLKNKGIKKVYFAIMPFEQDLKKAFAISYPTTILVNNLTMIITNMYNYIGYKGRSNLISELKNLYIQENYDIAKEIINCFKEKHVSNKIINILFQKYCSDIEKYYSYDLEVRKFLFNHNSFTDLFDIIRKTSKENTIEKEKDLIELLSNYIKNMEKNKYYNKNAWSNIINHCSNYLSELIEEAVLEL